MAGSCTALMTKFGMNLLKWCVMLWEESLSTHLIVMMGQAYPEYQLALVFA